jgi:hypothetical protein
MSFAHGVFVHVYVDHSTRKPVSLSAEMRAADVAHSEDHGLGNSSRSADSRTYVIEDSEWYR